MLWVFVEIDEDFLVMLGKCWVYKGFLVFYLMWWLLFMVRVVLVM